MIKPPPKKLEALLLSFSLLSSPVFIQPYQISQQIQHVRQPISIEKLKEIILGYYNDGSKEELKNSLSTLVQNKSEDIFSVISEELHKDCYYLFADEYENGYEFLLGKIVPDKNGRLVRKSPDGNDYRVLRDIQIQRKDFYKDDTKDSRSKEFRSVVEVRTKSFIINQDKEKEIISKYFDLIKKRYNDPKEEFLEDKVARLLDRDFLEDYAGIEVESRARNIPEESKPNLFFNLIEDSLYGKLIAHEDHHIEETKRGKLSNTTGSEARALLSEIIESSIPYLSLFEILRLSDISNRNRQANSPALLASVLIRERMIQYFGSEDKMYKAIASNSDLSDKGRKKLRDAASYIFANIRYSP